LGIRERYAVTDKEPALMLVMWISTDWMLQELGNDELWGEFVVSAVTAITA
tara:strand:- start:555 stop:707 length:153 start_codon:yes stop_codon:yes gene_type:complete